jgi:hypothetical protein
MQLYDILRVQCVYNSDTKELLISGLFGEATTVLDLKMSNRTSDHDTPRCRLPRIFAGGNGLHTVEE